MCTDAYFQIQNYLLKHEMMPDIYFVHIELWPTFLFKS